MAEVIDAEGRRWELPDDRNVTGHFGEFAPPGTISAALEQTRPLLMLGALAAVVLVVVAAGRRR